MLCRYFLNYFLNYAQSKPKNHESDKVQNNGKGAASSSSVDVSRPKETRKETLFQLAGPSTFELQKPKTKTKAAVAPPSDSRTNFIHHAAAEAPSVAPPQNPIRRILNPKQQEEEKPVISARNLSVESNISAAPRRSSATGEPPRRSSATGDVSGHEARAELMASLVDEKDATNYFLSKQSHKHAVKFLHLVPADPGYRGYCPYEMLVVSESDAETAPLHFVMTDTALTAITKEVDENSGAVTRIVDALTLGDWIHERDTFSILRKRFSNIFMCMFTQCYYY